MKAAALDGHEVVGDAGMRFVGEATKIHLLLVSPDVSLPPLRAPAHSASQMGHSLSVLRRRLKLTPGMGYRE